jgi:hypothetical protein
MSGSLNIISATVDPALLDLPWNLPLDLWPDDVIATLPKGISRHLVRFAHLSGYVIAIKETSAELARREYDMLRTLQKIDVPCVDPVAVITNRTDDDGNELEAVLVTRHLKFSLPLSRPVLADAEARHRHPLGLSPGSAAGASAHHRILLG